MKQVYETNDEVELQMLIGLLKATVYIHKYTQTGLEIILE